ASPLIYTLSLHDALPISARSSSEDDSMNEAPMGDADNTLILCHDSAPLYEVFPPLCVRWLQPPLIIVIGAVLAVLIGADFMNFSDRKSTRLNSSHVKISY